MLKHWPPLSTLRGFEAAARLGSFHKAAAEVAPHPIGDQSADPQP